MKVFALVAMGVALLLPGRAVAGTVISPESGRSYPYQQWVDRAKVPTPDETLTVLEGSTAEAPNVGCEAAVLGCAGIGQGWVFVAIAPQKFVAHETFVHELGHIYGGRSEVFAESYALCARFGLQAGQQRMTPVGFRPICKGLLSPLSDSWRGGRPAR